MSQPAPARLSRIARAVLPAAPLAFAAVPCSRAVIIYTDLGAGVSVSTVFAPIYFDLDHSGPGDGTNGFASTSSLSGADLRIAFRSLSPNKLRIDSTAAGLNPLANVPIGPFGYTPAYAFNAPIIGYPYNNAYYLTKGGVNSPWTSGTTAYIGLLIGTGSDFNYGWAYVNYTGNTVTLLSFAYDTVVNESILAGQTTAIPEPAITGAVAALLAGSAVVHRRRQLKKRAQSQR